MYDQVKIPIKDELIANDDEIKKIDGVMGVVRNGGQVQVVIGPQVGKVYDELQKTGSFSEKESVGAEAGETVTAEKKQKKTAMGVINNIIGALAGCLTPLIPVLLCCGMAKMLASVLGPNLFKFLDTQSNMFVLLTLIGDAGFYFLADYHRLYSCQTFWYDTGHGHVVWSNTGSSHIAEVCSGWSNVQCVWHTGACTKLYIYSISYFSDDLAWFLCGKIFT